MLLLIAVIASLVAIDALLPQASPLTAGMVLAAGIAVLVIGARTAGADGVLSRVAYLAATLSYLIALPGLTIELAPHHAAAPHAIAWGIPFLYGVVLPLALPLMPLVSRWTYARDAYRWARQGRNF